MGQKLVSVTDKQIRVGVEVWGTCAYLRLVFDFGWHERVCLYIAVAARTPSSYASFFILKAFGVFLKLAHSEVKRSIMLVRGKTTQEEGSNGSAVHIRGNNGCWIIESFLSHQPFVPGLMGFFSKRQSEMEKKFLFKQYTTNKKS